MPTRRRYRKGGAPSKQQVVDGLEKASTIINAIARSGLVGDAVGSLAGEQAGRITRNLGFGRKRRPRRPRKGAGFFDFLKNVASVPLLGAAGLAGGLNMGVQGLGRRGRGGAIPASLNYSPYAVPAGKHAMLRL